MSNFGIAYVPRVRGGREKGGYVRAVRKRMAIIPRRQLHLCCWLFFLIQLQELFAGTGPCIKASHRSQAHLPSIWCSMVKAQEDPAIASYKSFFNESTAEAFGSV
ncbi:hypothetical protein ALP05_200037 [Pseudomonas caricapapayae]|uniref:Uncharacterized protein n=1 Tax=Pseudomonas caricapapayae TaxID=46678 RepID=A0A3M6ERU4_9PSED|nr:hypothetical protein [Pseudomonas caricapapayae]RMV71062.1 hypothetical protein ALP05_200037 [Pseudomonas caricapapayae]